MYMYDKQNRTHPTYEATSSDKTNCFRVSAFGFTKSRDSDAWKLHPVKV
jgi:hypothetical protein